MITSTLRYEETMSNLHFSNLQTILIILTFCTRVLSDCPNYCECKWRSGKESVICINANLSSVPLQLDSGTQLLDLNLNNLIMIKNDEFSKAGLVNLQKVYISRCRLKFLDKYAFRDLINLIELDLSYNILTGVPSHTFDSITELRELKLSGNPIQRIVNNAFSNVPQLVRLELSECQVRTIENKAFSGLEMSLEWLKLDKNNLIDVEASSLTVLENLHGLELAENQWNCSCKLRSLREWLMKKNIPFGVPPVCYYPNRLARKTWNKLDLDEFACVPEILAMDPQAHGFEGRNVTLTCRTNGIPEPSVRWMVRNKVIANISGASSKGKKLYAVRLQKDSSDLTILAADIQDAGVYVCTAENKAGKAEASVTLAVSKRPVDHPLRGKVLLGGLVGGVFFALVSCSIAIYFCSLKKKQSMQWVERNHRYREDNYEKIEMNHKVYSECDNFKLENECVSMRKNGDYRLVPKKDIESEVEKTEQFEDDINKVEDDAFRNCTQKSWQSSDNKWTSTEFSLATAQDLHIPRRSVLENRDDCQKSLLTSGTFNNRESKFVNARENTLANQFFKGKLPGASDIKENSPMSSNLNCGSSNISEEGEEDKKYPDLIEGSSTLYRGSLTAISEGNSAADVRDLYGTLPRTSVNLHKSSRYSSTDSQLPLLPDSYGCKNDERNNSRSNSMKKLDETIIHKYEKKSNSYLNLTRSLPNATPLLDVSELDNRLIYRRTLASPSSASPLSTTYTNSYDYHAAQLERFLEEYRTLQKELTKMKETCDSLNKDKVGNNNNKNSETSHSLTPNSLNSNQALDNTLTNFENELSKYLTNTYNGSAF